MIEVNLCPEYRKLRRRRQQHLRKVVGVTSGYLLLLGIVYACFAIMGGSDERIVQRQLEALNKEYAEVEGKVKTLVPALRENKMTLEASRAVSVHPNWGTLLRLLTTEMNGKVALRGVEVTGVKRNSDQQQQNIRRAGVPVSTSKPERADDSAKSYDINMSGYALTQQDVTDYVLKLERLMLFDRVILVETKRQILGSGEVFAFVIRCTVEQSDGGGQ